MIGTNNRDNLCLTPSLLDFLSILVTESCESGTL